MLFVVEGRLGWQKREEVVKGRAIAGFGRCLRLPAEQLRWCLSPIQHSLCETSLALDSRQICLSFGFPHELIHAVDHCQLYSLRRRLR